MWSLIGIIYKHILYDTELVLSQHFPTKIWYAMYNNLIRKLYFGPLWIWNYRAPLTLIDPGIFLRTRSPGGGGFHPPYKNTFMAWYELVWVYPPKDTYNRGWQAKIQKSNIKNYVISPNIVINLFQELKDIFVWKYHLL